MKLDGGENEGSKKSWEEIEKFSQNEIVCELSAGSGFKTAHLCRISLWIVSRLWCVESSWNCLSYCTSATKTEDDVQIYFMKWVLHQYQTMKAEKLQTNFITKYWYIYIIWNTSKEYLVV